MELVANIWPIVDRESGFVYHFAARAYVMVGSDSEISTVLQSLAQSDYTLARQFPIPETFSCDTDMGDVKGLVPPRYFNAMRARIIEPALRALEQDNTSIRGIGINSAGAAYAKRLNPPFPEEPILCVTYLSETDDGELTPIRRN